ncbi:hypothetical protein SLS62_008542 [Diatrype stigma]|uniref:Ion transport domain-containing protein n=1 Tax=Diatrype stigma TaxID=117547 RepID=A0AAN9YMX6_9PEZI
MPARDLLSSLLRPRKTRTSQRVDSNLFHPDPQSPSPGPANRDYHEHRHATADFTEAEDEEEDHDEDGARHDDDDARPFLFPRASRFRSDETGRAVPNSLPIYNIVHAIRILVQTRTETTLSWDQIRSPQVSQFLVKPMQQQIRTQHFNRATLYALMANCLQFTKEGRLNPGNAGTSSTRAKVCELLALKLLKEYSTRELIDALSYDFYPLQGVPEPLNPNSRSSDDRNRPGAARSSTLEVAIRASAKHFLAHPLVVQQLEAIWNGAISFYSSQDSLHREPSMLSNIGKPVHRGSADARTPLLGSKSPRDDQNQLPLHVVPIRRTVMLYDPRNASLMNVLDHYQYFSQLLIAFRLMAMDLVAVLVLVLISCSGFFVFFTLSKNQNDAPEVAYKIFQILMGFTPAAWDVWPQYNILGRALLVIFLIICHFLVVTILITVLTNSFMTIASNAKEEHQFLFAINTISMVKNDALFSYMAPGNIFAWILMPLRYFMPIRQFVLLNRTVIKLTHFPILFSIFLYEKYFLAKSMYEPTDLIDNHGRGKPSMISFADPVNRGSLFSPNVRAREESVVGMQKDRALDEVFRRPPDASTIRNQRRQERKNTLTAIRTWMDEHDDDSGAPLSRWPTLGTLDGRASMSQRRRSMSRDLPRFRQMSDVRSAASDPADLFSNNGVPFGALHGRRDPIEEHQQQYKDQTDADGDDELMTNDDEEEEANTTASHQGFKPPNPEVEDYFTTPLASRRQSVIPSSLSSSSNRQVTATTSPRNAGPPRRRSLHNRTLSTNTILYAPQESSRHGLSPSSISEEPLGARSRPRTSRLCTTVDQSAPSGTRSPRKAQHSAAPARPRPIPTRSAPNRAALIPSRNPRPPLRRPSSVEVDMNSEIGLDAAHDLGAVPSSFATQMAMATGQLKGLGRVSQDREATDRLNRLVLAKMKTLEESFADVVKEMRVMRSGAPSPQHSGDDTGTGSWGRRAAARSDKSKSSKAGSKSGSKAGSKVTSLPGSVMGLSSSSSRREAAAAAAAAKKGKGKAKEIPVPASETDSGSEEEDIRRAPRRRGSSF